MIAGQLLTSHHAACAGSAISIAYGLSVGLLPERGRGHRRRGGALAICHVSQGRRDLAVSKRITTPGCGRRRLKEERARLELRSTRSSRGAAGLGAFLRCTLCRHRRGAALRSGRAPRRAAGSPGLRAASRASLGRRRHAGGIFVDVCTAAWVWLRLTRCRPMYKLLLGRRCKKWDEVPRVGFGKLALYALRRVSEGRRRVPLYAVLPLT